MATTLTTSFGYITLNGQTVTTSGNRVQIGLTDACLLISDSGAFATYSALTGFSGTQFGTGNYATQLQLYNTGSQLYQDITGMSGWAISTFTGGGGGVGTGGATTASLYLTGHNLYVDITGFSGANDARLAQTGSTLIALIHASAAGVSTLNGLSGALNIVGSGGITVHASAGTIGLGFTGTIGTTPTGAAGGSLAGTYPNPDTNSSYDASYGSMTVGGLGLFLNGGLTEKRVGYVTGGTVVIDFSDGAFAVIPLTSSISFSPSGGSGGVRDGARQTIVLYNTLGTTLTISYNNSWNGTPYAVTNVYPGQSVLVELSANGGSENNIYVATALLEGPRSSTSGNLPTFGNTLGNQLVDSGISAGNVVVQGGNATLSIAAITLAKLTQVSYVGSGNITIAFDDGNLGYILATGPISLSPGGSSGLGAACWQIVSIVNTVGSPITIAYNSSWIKSGSFPTTLASGTGFTLIFQVFGTNEADVICNSTYTGSGGGSGVTQIIAGANITLSPSGGTGAVTVTAVGGGTVPWIQATSYGVVADGSTDDTSGLAAAWTATVAAGGCLLLPAGTMRITSDPFASIATTGYVGMAGLGRQVTRFRQDGATSGLTFNLSTGSIGNNAVNLANFSVIGNNSGCTIGVTIDYGMTSACSADFHSTIDQVGVEQFSTEFWFRQCWDLQATNLYAYGNSTNYTAGSGLGTGACFLVDACINPNFSNIQHRFSKYGFQFVTTVDSSGCPGGHPGDKLSTFQGCQIVNYVGVEVLQMLWLTSNSFSGTLNVTNFTMDNGNILVSAHETIHLEWCGSFNISNGQILQNGGTNIVYIENSNQTQISNVNFLSPNVSQMIHFATGSTNSIVTSCGFEAGPIPILADSGTSNIRASANVYTSSPANVDNGSGNNIVQSNGF